MSNVDDQLREAVTAACHAEAASETNVETDLILAEFVVVAARQGWDDQGEPVTQVVVIPVDGSTHRILGLLRHATVTAEANLAAGDL